MDSVIWWIAQAIGAVAMIIAFLAFQGNSKKHILTFQILSCTFFGIQYLLLSFLDKGALTGALLNFMTVARNTIFNIGENPKNKWASIKVWSVVFSVAYTVVGIFTWSAWYSILPVIGIVCGTLAFLPKSPTVVRALHFPSSPCWLVYNAITEAWPGVLAECFTIASLIIAFIRFDILKQKKSTGETEGSDKA